MDQPEGFSIKGKEHLACKLKKSIMDLNKLLDNGILSLMIPLHLLDLTKTLLIGVLIWRLVGVSLYFFILYVDGILLASSDLGLLHETKKFLFNNFEMKDMGEATYVIWIEIFRDRSCGLLGLS